MTNVLIINGSSRRAGNSQILADMAEKGAMKVKEAKIHQFSFAGKTFAGCMAECSKYCMKHGTCSIDDGLRELWKVYLWADAIVWVVPVYHVGVPGQVKCAMDRLCNMQYSYFKGRYPRWGKVWGAIVQGASRFGGQEFTIQWLVESALLMKCLPVAADAPGSYFGVAGYAPTWEKGSIWSDEAAIQMSENMGQRVAETARIVTRGKACLADELDDVYFSDKCFAMRERAEVEVTNAWQKVEKNNYPPISGA